MNIYKQEYQKIVDELIRKSFPELRGKRIRVFEFNITKLYGNYIPFINFVGVNKLCRNFSEKEIRGILVHELCHAGLFKEYGFLKTLFINITYWFSPAIRKMEEDKADMLTIKKGYARELVLSSRRLEKEYPNHKDKTFMSIAKIKSYAKKIKKW